MKITNISHLLPFQKSNGTMQKANISQVIIHHDGVDRPSKYNSIKRYISEANYHISKGWSHISYAYILDNTGEIFQCLPETEVAYHCGNLAINKKSIAIKFDGNMETQKLTEKQIVAYKELMKYLITKRPDLPKIVKGCEKPHREIKATSCPGKNVTNSFIHKY
jgi:N-acetyl-anhydromuramyl-L-alanine amidase AmpD